MGVRVLRWDGKENIEGMGCSRVERRERRAGCCFFAWQIRGQTART